MRKKFLIIFFTLFYIQGNCQNYHSILENDTTYFECINKDYYFSYLYNKKALAAIMIDSVSGNPASQEIFNYKSFDRNNSCLLSSRSSFLGTKQIRNQTGIEIFINDNGDSVMISSTASAGNTWIFYEYSNGDYIQATINSVTNDSFLGLTDSVKNISLQTKNPSGVNIAGYFNGKVIKLSKTYGLIETYGFRNFPSDTTFYKFAGSSLSGNGYQNLIGESVFNFDVGDVFHYHNKWSASVPSYDEYFIEKTVISKSFSLNQDTVIYEYDNYYFHINSSFGVVTTTLIHDTVAQSFSVNGDDYFSGLPYEQASQNASQPWATYGYASVFFDTTYFSRSRKFSEDFYLNQGTGGIPCWPIGLGIFPQRIFAEGLGEIYETDPTLWVRYGSLVYYKKGNEEWGIPLKWTQILGTNDFNNLANVITIFPNPVNDFLSISIAEISPESDFTLFNASGMMIKSFRITDQHVTFDLTDLASGVYSGILKGNKNRDIFRIVKINW